MAEFAPGATSTPLSKPRMMPRFSMARTFFGDGDDAPGLYAAGPRPELLGQLVDGLAVSAGGETTFENFGETGYDPESTFAPVRIYGRIRGAPGPQDIAVAVNGRIAATATRVSRSSTRSSAAAWRIRARGRTAIG